MWLNIVATSVMSIFAGLLLVVCVGSYLWLKSTKPAATEPPFRAAGPRAGFDILPCPSSLVTAPPLAARAQSAAIVAVMGRGLNKDFYCAEDVAITITDREVWLEVDKDNLLRVKRIKRLLVNDWRAT